MKGTKEYYEIMDNFEMAVVNLPIYIGCKIERAPIDARHFYENGKLNDLFIIYLAGVSLGKLIERQ